MNYPGQDNVFYRNMRRRYPTIVRAEGVFLYDDEGKNYLDGSSGALVSSLGHGNSKIAQAIYEQSLTLEFAHAIQFNNLPLFELSRLLVEEAPGFGRVFFANSGSEITESAMKLARQYFLERGKPEKFKIVARWQSYHGNTTGALSMSGHTARRKNYAPYLIHAFPHIHPPYCYRCPFGKQYPQCGLECAWELERVIRQEGKDTVAAFIAEPVIGSSNPGVVPPADYYRVIREICNHEDVLFIADEVMTGVGRTGEFLAISHWGVTPDMVCLAKGLSGGFGPLAALLVKEEIYQTIAEGSGAFGHGHTFGGNPLSCAAGVATVKYLKEERLLDQIKEKGVHLRRELETLAQESEIVGDVRGLGLMLGIELVADRQEKTPFPTGLNLTEKVRSAAIEEGLVIYPGNGFVDGVAGDGFLVAPPFIITEEEMDELVKRLKRALIRVFQGLNGR
ncbi:MAG: aspartate aminotransferase family protein [Firmicutes bacterium]|nr:aspartate aminotransferase family protein [Bacillota bacterium]